MGNIVKTVLTGRAESVKRKILNNDVVLEKKSEFGYNRFNLLVSSGENRCYQKDIGYAGLDEINGSFVLSGMTGRFIGNYEIIDYMTKQELEQALQDVGKQEMKEQIIKKYEREQMKEWLANGNTKSSFYIKGQIKSLSEWEVEQRLESNIGRRKKDSWGIACGYDIRRKKYWLFVKNKGLVEHTAQERNEMREKLCYLNIFNELLIDNIEDIKYIPQKVVGGKEIKVLNLDTNKQEIRGLDWIRNNADKFGKNIIKEDNGSITVKMLWGERKFSSIESHEDDKNSVRKFVAKWKMCNSNTECNISDEGRIFSLDISKLDGDSITLQIPLAKEITSIERRSIKLGNAGAYLIKIGDNIKKLSKQPFFDTNNYAYCGYDITVEYSGGKSSIIKRLKEILLTRSKNGYYWWHNSNRSKLIISKCKSTGDLEPLLVGDEVETLATTEYKSNCLNGVKIDLKTIGEMFSWSAEVRARVGSSIIRSNHLRSPVIISIDNGFVRGCSVKSLQDYLRVYKNIRDVILEQMYKDTKAHTEEDVAQVNLIYHKLEQEIMWYETNVGYLEELISKEIQEIGEQIVDFNDDKSLFEKLRDVSYIDVGKNKGEKQYYGGDNRSVENVNLTLTYNVKSPVDFINEDEYVYGWREIKEDRKVCKGEYITRRICGRITKKEYDKLFEVDSSIESRRFYNPYISVDSSNK